MDSRKYSFVYEPFVLQKFDAAFIKQICIFSIAIIIAGELSSSVDQSPLKQTKPETSCISGVGQKGKIIPQENEHANQIDGEWSHPMSKVRMMRALRFDDYRSFNNFAKLHGIKDAGSRELYQIRVDMMDRLTRAKLEKA